MQCFGKKLNKDFITDVANCTPNSQVYLSYVFFPKDEYNILLVISKK